LDWAIWLQSHYLTHYQKKSMQARMEQLNITYLDTRWGRRSFELWCGDIIELPFAVDLLIVSSFGFDVTPMAGTVIGALSSRLDISVESLQENPEVDFIQPLSLWVSAPIGQARIGRVMCLHIPPFSINAEQIVEQAFFTLPLLEARRLPLKTVCLPVLGTGAHGLSEED
jgi:hypothetical protein